MADVIVPSQRDGGYHAIKGFIFQFDKTLLDVFAGELDQEFEVEGEQDLITDVLYTQVKYRGGNYALSVVAPAIRLMMAQHVADPRKLFALYCYFPDKMPGTEYRLSAEDLDSVLGGEAVQYDSLSKKEFLKHFLIRFSEDLDRQFDAVIAAIRRRYPSCKSNADAIAKHAILHQHLMRLVLKQPFGARITTPKSLDVAIETAEEVVFYSAYQSRLGASAYIALLKDQFKPRTFNAVRRERLVIVECSSTDSIHDLVDIAGAVKRRFYIAEQTTQPYLVFRGVSDLNALKRAVWNADLKFVDGTYFDGDQLRLDYLVASPHKDIGIKLVADEQLDDLVDILGIQVVFDFFVTDPRAIAVANARSRQMYIDAPGDVVKVLS